MTCSDVISVLEALAPGKLACDWDNPGLLVGRREKQVSKVLVTLDVTDRVIDYGIQIGADMIVSHHPLIFGELQKINDDDVFGRRLLKLIRQDISCFAMHTNFDIAQGGMGDLAADCLELEKAVPFAEMTEYTLPDRETVCHGGIGRIGFLREPMNQEAFVSLVKSAFDVPSVLCFGINGQDRQIRKVAICPGSGKEYISEALGQGADAYVSGDIGHHGGLDGAEQGLLVIDAGHYGVEHIFIPAVCSYLQEKLPENLEIVPVPDWRPFQTI